MADKRETGSTTSPLYDIKVFSSQDVIFPDVLEFYGTLNRNLRAEGDRPEKLVEWQKHIDKSKNAILDASKGLQGSALILGMGNAMDIPLGEFSSQFDHITVVEMDQEAAELVLGRLSEIDQKKITLIVDDLTGAIADGTDKVRTAISKNDNISTFVEEVSTALNTMTSRSADVGGGYSFVCSSLVLSQLVSTIYEYSRELANKKYGIKLQPSESTFSYFEVLTELSSRLQIEHIDLIYSSLKSDGRAYLSDTVYQTRLIKAPFREPVITARSFPMVTGETIRHLGSKFEIAHEQSWEWRRNPPKDDFIPTVGGGFEILAMSLAPRAIE